MSQVTIRLRDHGPLVVEGPVTIIDATGQSFTVDSTKPGIALCRCGQSQRKPFCDASHKACGFTSAERAAPPAAGNDAS